MSLNYNCKQLFKFNYDFAKHGGAIGAIELDADIAELKAGYHIVDAYVVIEDALTSAGTPTLTLGPTSDADGYFADFQTLSGAGKAFRVGQFAGALLFDDTNDTQKVYSPTASNELDLKLTIGSSAVTGGKFSVYLEAIAKSSN